MEIKSIRERGMTEKGDSVANNCIVMSGPIIIYFYVSNQQSASTILGPIIKSILLKRQH